MNQDKVLEIINLYKELINKIGVEKLIINMIVSLGIILIYMYVFKNFKQAKEHKNNTKKEVKSVVETTSMSAFFLLCYIIIMFQIGTFSFSNTYVNIFALCIYIIGVSFNILGRVFLGTNWGNNVVIYDDHTLVTKGPYKLVRHPLYASIIWMIYATSILYNNYLVAILNTVIFIPFMTYRAKQEEKELIKVFDNYLDYKKRVGMFFPKLIKRKEVK